MEASRVVGAADDLEEGVGAGRMDRTGHDEGRERSLHEN